jgi:amino acid permease
MPGRYVTEFFLWTTQFGLTCAYVYFIKVNFQKIIFKVFNGTVVHQNWIALGCWIVFSGLCLVRKIEKFAATHIFADIMIFMTVIACFVYGASEIKHYGS